MLKYEKLLSDFKAHLWGAVEMWVQVSSAAGKIMHFP